jgi:hypothetical protein
LLAPTAKSEVDAPEKAAFGQLPYAAGNEILGATCPWSCSITLRRIRKMSETVKKTAKPKAPAKPRKTAAKKTANGAANGAAKVTEMPLVYEQVAVLAHSFWVERGHQHGNDAEDWFRAEQALRSKAS